MEGVKFNSKTELNLIMDILSTQDEVTVSDFTDMCNKIRDQIEKIHHQGFTEGYNKGVDIKEEIKNTGYGRN